MTSTPEEDLIKDIERKQEAIFSVLSQEPDIGKIIKQLQENDCSELERKKEKLEEEHNEVMNWATEVSNQLNENIECFEKNNVVC